MDNRSATAVVFRGNSFRNDATLLRLHRSAGRRRGLSAQARHDALLFCSDLPDIRSVSHTPRTLAPGSRPFFDLAKRSLWCVYALPLSPSYCFIHARLFRLSFVAAEKGEGAEGRGTGGCARDWPRRYPHRHGHAPRRRREKRLLKGRRAPHRSRGRHPRRGRGPRGSQAFRVAPPPCGQQRHRRKLVEPGAPHPWRAAC